MSGPGSIWRKLFMRFGLLALTMNLVLVSIPRCDMVLALLQHHDAGEEGLGESCHETELPSDGTSPMLTSHRVCECAVFQFMAFHAPALNINEHVAFRVQSERLLVFPWNIFLTDFQPLLEPPYPKTQV